MWPSLCVSVRPVCDVPERVRNRRTALVSSGDRSLRDCGRARLPVAGCPVVGPCSFFNCVLL